MEKVREFHKPIYICFNDLRKAYESMNQNSLDCVAVFLRHSKKLFPSFALYINIQWLLLSAMGRLQVSLPSQVVSIRAVYWLLHSLIYTLMWPIHMALKNGQPKGRGVEWLTFMVLSWWATTGS